mmetsp:Transcript_58814/g.140220  ORF Transcript_58814/g.140220 Transcript_58814/m.140220 type:complete len:241 (-) Transcript_58814:172-894(-)
MTKMLQAKMVPWYVEHEDEYVGHCSGEQREVNSTIKGLFYSSLGPCYIQLDSGARESSSTSFPSLHHRAPAVEPSSALRIGEGESKLLTAETVMSKNIATLMMHGLPPTFGTPFVASWLCEMNLQGHFDYIYTPYDVKTDTNQGYAFINLCSVEAAAALVGLTTGLHLDGHNQEVHYMAADIQGAEALLKKMAQRKLHRIRNPQLRPYIARKLLRKDWVRGVIADPGQLLACTHLDFPRG